MSTWVLLRGLMREQRHWGEFPALLQATLPAERIVTLDFPGNGEHFAQPSCTTVGAMVEAGRATLQAQGLRGPYRLLALSLGAMVAVEWSARYPGEIDGAVLINTSMRPFSHFYQRLRWRNYAALLALLVPGGARRREATILRLTSNAHQADGALLQRWMRYRADAPVSRINALRQLLAAARYRAPAVRPPVPMLVLASTNDSLVSVQCSSNLGLAWGVACTRHASAGHDLPLDDGPWLVDVVAKWHVAQ